MTGINVALTAGAIVVVTEPVAIALLRRAAAVDMPGLRSSHTVPTPRGGGAPIAAIAAVWLTGVVNAFNFMDGVNGISAAHALIGGVVYGCLGAWCADPFLVTAGAAVAAVALAFLPWNAVRARVFLGDVGSYGLGAALAVLAAYSLLHGVPAEAAIAPLALYLADTAWTLQRRVRAGERWLEGHRTHIDQRWCDVGWSHQRVTVVSAAAAAALCLLGAASLAGNPALRVAADLAGAGLLPPISGRLRCWRAARLSRSWS